MNEKSIIMLTVSVKTVKYGQPKKAPFSLVV